MPNCATIQSFTLDLCSGSLGGVKRIWVANYQSGAATVGKGSGDTASIDVITGFTVGVKFLEIPVRKNTSSYSSEVQVNETNGNTVQTTLNIVLPKMEASKRMFVNALLMTDVMAVVEDANGKKVFLGYDNPVTISAGTGETGTAKTDTNAYSISIQDDSVNFPYFLSDALEVPVDGE